MSEKPDNRLECARCAPDSQSEALLLAAHSWR